MFRLVNFDEESELYTYLSSIASETICFALEEWLPSDEDVEEFYWLAFGADVNSPISPGEIDDIPGELLSLPEESFEKESSEKESFEKESFEKGFFAGISEYFSAGEPEKEVGADSQVAADDLIGIDIIRRKLRRMKEKMADPVNYYTFDLFEEFLFNMMTEYYQMAAITQGFESQGIDPEDLDDDFEIELEYDTDDEDILETIRALIEDYGIDPEDAPAMGYAVYRPELMGPDNENEMFFWDEDFQTVFDEGFVPGIKKFSGGLGMILGYNYENVKEIFTDINMPIPLKLIGTKEEYILRGEAVVKSYQLETQSPSDES